MFTEASRKSQLQVSWQETGFKLRTTNVKLPNARFLGRALGRTIRSKTEKKPFTDDLKCAAICTFTYCNGIRSEIQSTSIFEQRNRMHKKRNNVVKFFYEALFLSPKIFWRPQNQIYQNLE
jgi:hypothetical protein